jgi:hypothetical protein
MWKLTLGYGIPPSSLQCENLEKCKVKEYLNATTWTNHCSLPMWESQARRGKTHPFIVRN